MAAWDDSHLTALHTLGRPTVPARHCRRKRRKQSSPAPCGPDQQLVVLGWESPFAIVEVGNVTTALGGSGEADGTRLQRWSVADAVWTPDTGAGTVNYTLPCADGSLARAAVVEQRAMEASGGWQRSIELQRRCPKVYHHMMVNIASDKPVLLRSQSRSVSEGT